MTDYTKIDNEAAALNDMGELVAAYETIATSAMQRIRGFVLENRAFHEGLNRIFREVVRVYRKEMERLMKERKVPSQKYFSLIRRNGTTVRILLSANTGLYGEIIMRLFERFVAEARAYPGDIMIVGRVGRALWEQVMPDTPFTYFDFSDSAMVSQDLHKITEHASAYERVVVFHGAFRSLVKQDAAASDVSGSGQLGAGADDGKAAYLFEPSLEGVAITFETEIFSSLLEQLFHESRLAKVAGRMMLLDRAANNIGRTIKHVSFERGKIRHRLFNRKQLDALSGTVLWNSTI